MLANGSVEKFVAFFVPEYFGQVDPAAARIEVSVDRLAYLRAHSVQVFVGLKKYFKFQYLRVSSKFLESSRNFTTDHVKIVKIPSFFSVFFFKIQGFSRFFFCLNCQVQGFSRIQVKWQP